MTFKKLLLLSLINAVCVACVESLDIQKKMGLYRVWHCGDAVLVNQSIQFMEQFDLGLSFEHMQNFLGTYRDGAWTLIHMTYGRSLAYTIDKESLTGLTQIENPNLCYISRLDSSLLMIMVRVYKDK